MRKLKYIRTRSTFILFSEPLMHSEINVHEEIISAGFYWLNTDPKFQTIEADCYGESISLRIKSLPEDSQLLTKQLNGEY